MNDPDLISAAKAAKMLGVTASLLKHWRARRMKLSYYQPGGKGCAVMYDLAEVKALIERGLVSKVDEGKDND